jgi:transposase
MAKQALQDCLRTGVPRRIEMRTPEEVSAMLALQARGWGTKRIARELGCSRNTVKRWLSEGGWRLASTVSRRESLDGLEDWLSERVRRHAGNADVVRQELLAEKGISVSLRTVERAVAPLRQALRAEARATVRFKTRPGQQLQIDFGQRRVLFGGEPVKAFLFVATLGYSRRAHVRAFTGEKQERWFEGMESAFRAFGGITEEVLLDNARAVITHHDPVSREVVVNPRLHAFARHWGFQVRACAPYRARTKGKGERGVGYVEHNAVAGRSFETPSLSSRYFPLDPGVAWHSRVLQAAHNAVPRPSESCLDFQRSHRRSPCIYIGRQRSLKKPRN